MESIRIDKDRCTLCGLCIPVCVRRILEEGEEAVRVTDPAMCILCGHCKAVCPEDAPQLPTLRAEEFEPAANKEDLPGPEGLMALFRSRRSTRIFRKDPVEREKIERILQAGRFAPTGGNRQSLQYIVLHSKEKLEEIRSMTLLALADQARRIEGAIERQRTLGEPLPKPYRVRQTYVPLWKEMAAFLEAGIDRLFYHAPAVIVCHLDPAGSTFPDVDAGLAAMQMALMAESLGLGTCFCGFFVFAIEESPDLRRALGIPDGHRTSLAFMLGYPDVTFLRWVSRNPAQIRWF